MTQEFSSYFSLEKRTCKNSICAFSGATTKQCNTQQQTLIHTHSLTRSHPHIHSPTHSAWIFWIELQKPQRFSERNWRIDQLTDEHTRQDSWTAGQVERWIDWLLHGRVCVPHFMFSNLQMQHAANWNATQWTLLMTYDLQTDRQRERERERKSKRESAAVNRCLHIYITVNWLRLLLNSGLVKHFTLSC